MAGERNRVLAFPPPWRYGPRLAGRYHLTLEQENLRQEALALASTILREVKLHRRKNLPSIDVQVLKTWRSSDGQSVDAHAICIPGDPEAEGEQWSEIRLWWWEGRDEDRGAIDLDQLLRHELAHWYCLMADHPSRHGSSWMFIALGFGCALDEVVRANILQRAKDGEEWEDDPQLEVDRACRWAATTGKLDPDLHVKVDEAYARVLGDLRRETIGSA